MSISSLGASFYNPPFRQQPGFDLAEMMQKAEVFAKSYHHGNDELLDYINTILNDAKFQSDPRGYLDDWKRKRSNSEVLKFPQDIARRFFDNNFKF